MRSKILFLLLFLVIAGCAEDKNIFMVEGTITDVNLDEQQIYVDGFWLPVRDVEAYNLGDVVKAEVESRAKGDSYDPAKTIVKKIEIEDGS
ncbi:hypothetical protein [Paenibacillus dakarensis]|uniref:hypothetical protein n=1 Tax=Paenibacillus dakarensis TaxID=1527293 RepID=UPI0006D57A71|nr:hypothetical protein [Paenibacillus dakarensis]